MFLAASIAITFFCKLYNETYLPSRNLVMTAFEIFAVETAAWLVWRSLLYPNLFSPLRALPGPPVCPFHLLFPPIRLNAPLPDFPSLAITRAVPS